MRWHGTYVLKDGLFILVVSRANEAARATLKFYFHSVERILK